MKILLLDRAATRRFRLLLYVSRNLHAHTLRTQSYATTVSSRVATRVSEKANVWLSSLNACVIFIIIGAINELSRYI